MSNPLLSMRLYTNFYILLCFVFSSLAAWNFRTKLSRFSTTSDFLSLLVTYLIVLAALAFLLAVFFALMTPGRFFAIVGFVSAQLFFVLPITLLIFSLIVWTSRTSPLSRATLAASGLTLVIAAVLLLGIYIYAHFIEPYRLQTVFHQVRSKKLANLDRPLRIVVLADIQTDEITDYERKVFLRTLELKPDLILFAGDYLQCPDRESYHLQAQRLAKMLKDLSFDAPLGAFAVIGHCESRNGNDCFGNTAIQWLNDRTITIAQDKAAIRLTGLSVQNGAAVASGSADLLKHLDSASFNIVLSHQPDFALDLPDDHDVDLYLAGHTHGGQIHLPFVGALTTACRIPRSQASGSHQVNGTNLCISGGLGMERGWAPRLRFFCPPQIMVIELMPK